MTPDDILTAIIRTIDEAMTRHEERETAAGARRRQRKEKRQTERETKYAWAISMRDALRDAARRRAA